jgi:hypothetical protein
VEYRGENVKWQVDSEFNSKQRTKIEFLITTGGDICKISGFPKEFEIVFILKTWWTKSTTCAPQRGGWSTMDSRWRE